jgi:hypothetical protein
MARMASNVDSLSGCIMLVDSGLNPRVFKSGEQALEIPATPVKAKSPFGQRRRRHFKDNPSVTVMQIFSAEPGSMKQRRGGSAILRMSLKMLFRDTFSGLLLRV